MTTIFIEGGWFMWVVAAAGVAMAAFAVTGMAGLARGRTAAETTTHADAVLFWGAFALVAGFLGTAVGLYQMARAIETMGEVATSLAWGGFRLTLITTQAGLVVFLLALLLWFGLWYAARRRGPAVQAPSIRTS